METSAGERSRGKESYHKHTIITMIKTYYWPCITIISRQTVRAVTRTPSLWDRIEILSYFQPKNREPSTLYAYF